MRIHKTQLPSCITLHLVCSVYSSRPQYLFCVSLRGTPEGMTKGNLLPLYADSAFAVIQKPFLLLVHTRLPRAVSGLTPCLDHLNNPPTKEFTALPATVVGWKDTHRYVMQFSHGINKYILSLSEPRRKETPAPPPRFFRYSHNPERRLFEKL